MNIKELYDQLDARIPASLSCEWDRDGLQLCPDPDREVRRVLVALDVTGEVADEAVDGGFDAIVSHHPLIFTPLGSITTTDGAGAKIINLIRAGIGVMSFHTRLDALGGGVNDALADALGLIDVEPFVGEDGIAMGRIGELCNPEDAETFAGRVKDALAAPAVLLARGGRQTMRVALLGGEGKDDILAARAAGADTFVSGRLGYHNMLAADEIGMNLIEAGHFYTEDPVCDRISELIASADEGIETVYMKSCTIKLI